MATAAIVGFLFGFVGSIPIAGPIAALVLARGLEGRFRSGLFIAVGAAVAESVFAFLAFLGFGVLLEAYPWVEPLCKGLGAAILFGLGFYFVRKTEPPRTTQAVAAPPRSRGYGSALLGFSITIMNPTLIATWTSAVTVAFSAGLIEYSPAAAGLFGVGACLGVACWFATMLALMHKLRGRFRPETVDKIRRGTGVLVLLLAVAFVLQLALHLLA